MDDCPLCGLNPAPGSPGAVLGAYARAERQRADLLDTENRELNRKLEAAYAEIKIMADAIQAFASPRQERPELNIIQRPLQLPPE